MHTHTHTHRQTQDDLFFAKETSHSLKIKDNTYIMQDAFLWHSLSFPLIHPSSQFILTGLVFIVWVPQDCTRIIKKIYISLQWEKKSTSHICFLVVIRMAQDRRGWGWGRFPVSECGWGNLASWSGKLPLASLFL